MKPLQKIRDRVVGVVDLVYWVNREAIPNLANLVRFANAMLSPKGFAAGVKLGAAGEWLPLLFGKEGPHLPDEDALVLVDNGNMVASLPGELTDDRTYTISPGSEDHELFVVWKLGTEHQVTLVLTSGSMVLPAGKMWLALAVYDPMLPGLRPLFKVSVADGTDGA